MIMGIIDYSKGCQGAVGCFGPDEPFFSVLGSETRFLGMHFIVALILGIVLFGILSKMQKNNKITIRFPLIILISIVGFIFFFFLFALLFPMRVVY